MPDKIAGERDRAEPTVELDATGEGNPMEWRKLLGVLSVSRCWEEGQVRELQKEEKIL